MSKTSRLMTVLASLLLAAALALPTWRINLVAPQYPEGLGMHIHVSSLRGATEIQSSDNRSAPKSHA